jgi:hypothetical protein
MSLHLNKVLRANAGEQCQGVGVAGNQEVLPIVDFIVSGGMPEGPCPPAGGWGLLQDENGYSRTGKLNARREPAEPATDNYDRMTCARCHGDPRMSREYFSLWLNQ